jgi:hypothetical protein
MGITQQEGEDDFTDDERREKINCCSKGDGDGDAAPERIAGDLVQTTKVTGSVTGSPNHNAPETNQYVKRPLFSAGWQTIKREDSKTTGTIFSKKNEVIAL